MGLWPIQTKRRAVAIKPFNDKKAKFPARFWQGFMSFCAIPRISLHFSSLHNPLVANKKPRNGEFRGVSR